MQYRLETKYVGDPLDGVHSLLKFLCAMYDACVIQRNLYRKCRRLNRDISKGNIVFAPDTNDYQEFYADVRFVNQVLAKDKNTPPKPACLVIDLEAGVAECSRYALEEYTGTSKFMARSISHRQLLDNDWLSEEVAMPSTEGPLADYCQFMHTTEYQVLDKPGSTTQPEVEFTHRLFHDAESMLWVIAWTLIISVKPGSKPESDPHARFCHYFHTMTHFPALAWPSSRENLSYFSASKYHWECTLHPDLAMLAPMLANMFRYVRPEWAHRTELNAEHIHEALMRLLLIEIVKIKNDGTDIEIDIGGRKVPPIPFDLEFLIFHPTESESSSVSSIV